MSPSKKLPFNGKTTSRDTFKYQRDRIEAVEKFIPIDEVRFFL